jgi:chromosome segregation ATPase
MYGLCRSLHHALLTKRSQVLRDKLTELEKKKQQLRIDSGQDSQSIEEMVARKESLQQSLNELHARLEVIERDKTALGVEEDQQYAAEGTQQVKVNSLQKNIEAFNREMEAKKATITENNEAVAKLEVGASQPTPVVRVFCHDRPMFFANL